MMENMGYGRERLKDMIEKEAEEEVKGQQQQEEVPAAAKQQQQDDEECDMVPKINLVHKGRREKEFWLTGNDHGQYHTIH